MTGIAAAILAGGKNTRMKGKNKALVSVGGVAIIRRTLSTLREIFKEIIIVTNSERDFSAFKKSSIITSDLIKNSGPLAGIYSALSVTTQQAVFFVACDMPFLHNGFIQEQINCFRKSRCDCLLPRIGNLAQPIHAIYKKSLESDIRKFILYNQDHSLAAFLKTVNTRYLDLENSEFYRRIFMNVNTSEDLKNAQKELSRILY